MRAESAARIIKLGLTNFWRNRWLSFAATLIMTLTLLIISFFAISNLAIGKTTQSIRARIDVSAFFDDTVSTNQIVDLQKNLAARSDVKTVTYISKEEALIAFKKIQAGKKIGDMVTSSDNPLFRSLEIKANQTENLQAIADYLGQDQFKPIIESISYQDNKTFIERLIAITAFSKEFGWLLCAAFIIISILVIINTIRLTIFTRRDEIEIMRLVGANDSFVKIPFLIEGLLYGVIATIFSMGIVWAGLAMLVPRIQHYLGNSSSQQLMAFFVSNFWLMLVLELVVGMAIGIVCSFISIRKHLKY